MYEISAGGGGADPRPKQSTSTILSYLGKSLGNTSLGQTAQTANAKLNGSYSQSYIANGGNPTLVSSGSLGNSTSSSTSSGNIDTSSGAASPSSKSIDYLNADLAKHYKLSKETAYQEALSNTSYQRAVADMKAAGLNPAALYGSGNVSSGSDGVGYVSSSSSGRGGGGGGYSRTGSSVNSKLFSSGMYNLLQLAGGAIGVVATGRASGYYVGSTAARGVMSALNGLFGG